MDNTVRPHQRVFFAARQALRRHVSGSNILILATLGALVIANIPSLSPGYFNFWEQEVRLQIGGFNLFSHAGHPMSLLAFINDALMAVFFFTIGLEIKREILVGQLSSFRNALLPILAAVGGMIVPVVIFLCFARATDFLTSSMRHPKHQDGQTGASMTDVRGSASSCVLLFHHLKEALV